MDETLERLAHFLNALQTFNDRLTQSLRELSQLRETVSPHWQDAAQRWHDQLWMPLEEAMSHYLNVEAPGYAEFVQTRINALRGYLDG